ncbi:Fe-S cluster assembly sulfur transfer protein SufU [Prosthecobacter sp.]|uniref:Fe-S cluster assembly sulfur transfer protein SufU n=1 Tax=Prosthecobacter sp. TaxID=1965333 RepID=UPI001DADEB53|nr:SUF system NifU family Fe-S cluster assembly protein [Prosthecobacter sp.]MCB1276422.1 SUF system NifU family Fe-S cluster assembly protein [Prosthecobacter sp.]
MPLSDELRDLYQQVILDHSRNPRNHGEIPPPCLHAHGDNPSCGDEIDVYLRLTEDGQIEDLKFTGQGCAISQASASMMTQKIKGKSKAEAEAIREDFRRVVMGDGAPADEDALGELILLEGVQKFPQRVKCAMLAWRAVEQALEGK